MADNVSTLSWCQVQPEIETRPCGRDIRGNSFVHHGALHLFGGLNCFMGPRQAGYSLPLDDLWCCHLGC